MGDVRYELFVGDRVTDGTPSQVVGFGDGRWSTLNLKGADGRQVGAQIEYYVLLSGEARVLEIGDLVVGVGSVKTIKGFAPTGAVFLSDGKSASPAILTRLGEVQTQRFSN